MAHKKTLKTRQKFVFCLPPQKPRNPVAQAARERNAGAHGTSRGGERVTERALLQKLLRDIKEGNDEEA